MGRRRDQRRAARRLLLLAGLLGAPAQSLAQEKEDPADAPRALQTVVTALRSPRPLREAPSTLTVLPRKELERSAAATTDAVLRVVPSVATFRRSTSLVADPSSQGVNLRGLGPSAISRSLVLLDGLPVNDAFGGWVYWRALPRLGLDRIEVAQGGSSSQYGNAALGGVIQLFSRPAAAHGIDLDASIGSYETAQLSARVAFGTGRIHAALEGDVLRSDGFHIVPASQRGPVDTPTPSRSLSGAARLDAAVTDALSLRFRLRGFDEAQNGGTRLTTANVWTRQLLFGARYATEAWGTLEADVFSGQQRFAQSRARVETVPPERRNVEFFAGRQNTPSSDLGASVVWSAPVFYGAGKHALSLGADTRQVQGEAREFFPSGAIRVSGGAQSLTGAYLQNLYRPNNRFDVLASLRVDHWASFEGFSRLDGADTSFSNASGLELSPRIGGRAQLLDAVAVRASAWRAFRAPTLNELYRPFQVGAVTTLANAELKAESVVGGEVGLELSAGAPHHARVTGFWNELDRPIINATVNSNTRQRQNLGHARVAGFELENEWRPIRWLTFIAGYTFVSPVVTERPDAPELAGLDLPQDPRHRLSAQLAFAHPRYLDAAVYFRFTSQQFEDDRGDLPMDGYALVDLFASREISNGISVFGAVENLLGAEYLVGRAGVDTVGAPRTFRVGLRLRSDAAGAQ